MLFEVPTNVAGMQCICWQNTGHWANSHVPPVARIVYNVVDLQRVLLSQEQVDRQYIIL